MTTKKIPCRICGKSFHVLPPHLASIHKINGAAAILEKYVSAYGGPEAAPLMSALGAKYLLQLGKTKKVLTPRKKISVEFKSLFPEFGLKKGGEYTGTIEIYEKPGPLTPKLNPHYVFPEEATMDFLACIQKPQRNRIYILGPSGTGKTDLVRNIAAKVNAELMVVNGDAYLQRSHFVGTPWVEGDKMTFKKGPLPRAMEQGLWFLNNEFDTQTTDIVNTFKPVLEDPPYLPMPEIDDDTTIEAAPDFRFIATANTGGLGDDTGQFVNTRAQSTADMRRWTCFLKVGYMAPEDEILMLRRYFGDDLTPTEAAAFVKVANKIREAFMNRKIDKTLSPAEVITWVENWIACAKTPHHAARISITGGLSDAVAGAIHEIVNAVFGSEDALLKGGI